MRGELRAFALWFWDGILSGMASVFEAVPVPGFLTNIETHTMPDGISWAASAFQLDVRLAIIVPAYTARFLG